MHFHVFSHAYDNMFVRHSGLFVDFFFVLSGFVISHAYGRRLGTVSDLRSFVIRRFGRLWPLHLAVLAAFVASTVAKGMLGTLGLVQGDGPIFEGTRDWPAIFTNLVLIQALGIHDSDTWNAPSWSISVEFYTYLLFALACFLATMRRRRLPLSIAAVIAFGAALIVWLFSPQLLETTYDFGLWRCVYGFFVGHLAYRAWQTLASRQRSAAWAGAMEVPLVVVVVCFATYLGSGKTTMLAPLVFAAAVVCFAIESGRLSRLLLTRPFALLGKWSYSIYMVHAFIIHCLWTVLKLRSDPNSPLIADMLMPGTEGMVPTIVLGGRINGDIAVLAYVAAVLITAMLTYRFIEEPGRRFFNRIASSSESRSDTSTAASVT
jgi:peptidoglycan/LPS O-acetylase OafA/YrhL